VSTHSERVSLGDNRINSVPKGGHFFIWTTFGISARRTKLLLTPITLIIVIQVAFQLFNACCVNYTVILQTDMCDDSIWHASIVLNVHVNLLKEYVVQN
jgi:hypothetical protein